MFYSILSDTSGYARTADYDDLIDLPDLDIYVLKDSLENYTTSADLYDTLSIYQQLDSNLTDLVEDGILSASKVEYGITSQGTEGQAWISDGDGSGEWGIPTAIAADDIITGDGDINIITTNGGINIVPAEGSSVVLDSTTIIDGAVLGHKDDTDLITLSPDTMIVAGTIVASSLTGGAVLDEDDMVSDSETHLATQQSIKAYIDTKQDSDENLEIISSLEHGDGNFIVSDGTDWTVESDSTARESLGLGTIATQDIENIDIDGGSIDGTTIGSTSPTTGSFTTLDASSRAYVGSVTINSGSITDDSGSISFGDANISTTGNVTVSDTVSAEQLTSTDDLTVADQASIDGTLTLATGSITDSGGAIDFGNGNLSTTGTLASGTQTVTGLSLIHI